MVEESYEVLHFTFPAQTVDADGRIVDSIFDEQLMFDIYFKDTLCAVVSKDDVVESAELCDGSIGVDFVNEFE